MEKDSFIFYKSFKEAIDICPVEVRLSVYEAIAEYALTEQEPTLTDPYAQLCWKLIKPQLEANWRRYKNGQAGGAPRGNQNAAKRTEGNNQETTEREPTNNQETTNKQANENVNVNSNNKEKDNNNEKEVIAPTRSRFTPPSVSEVEEYCRERGNGIDAQHFCDHYTANGWKQSNGNAIKDWKAAVRTWERNGINSTAQSQGQQPQRYDNSTTATTDTGRKYRYTSAGLLEESELLKYRAELQNGTELSERDARYLQSINEEIRRRGIKTRRSTI